MLLGDIYSEIQSKDSQVSFVYDTDGAGTMGQHDPSADSTDSTKEYYVKNWVKGLYYDTYGKKAAAVALQYYGKVSSTLSKLASTATTLDKVNAVKALAEEAKTKVNEAYNKAVSDAKVEAIKNAGSLYNNGKKGNGLSAEQNTAILTSATSAINSASTLQGITEAVDSTVKKTPVLLGSYNELERVRQIAFGNVTSALTTVHAKDASFPTSTPTEATDVKAYKAFKEKLAGYGVTELPLDIAIAYQDKIASATSLGYGVDSDGKEDKTTSALGQEAAKAITDSVSGIVAKVRQSIIDDYDKLINGYSTDTSWRATYHAYVVSDIDNWIKSYASTALLTDMVSAESDGGIGAIETDLCDDTNQKHYDASFNAYRLNAKKSEYVTKIKAALKEVLDGDTLYNSMLTAKVTGVDGVTSGDYANAAALDTKLTIASGTTAAIKAVKPDTAVITGVGYQDVQKYVIDMIGTGTTEGTDGLVCESTVTSTADVITKGEAAISGVATVYANALSTFTTSQGVDFSSASGLFTETMLQSSFDSMFVDSDGKALELTMAEILAKCKSTSKWVECANELGTKYAAYIAKFATDDAPTDKHFDTALAAQKTGNNSLWNYVGAEGVEDNTSIYEMILNGSITSTTAVDDLVTDDILDGYYKKAVADYSAKSLDYIKEAYTSAHTSAGTLLIASNLEKAYNALVKVNGYDATDVSTSNLAVDGKDEKYLTMFKSNTFASSDDYYEDSVALIKLVAADGTIAIADVADITNGPTADELAALLLAAVDKGMNLSDFCASDVTVATLQAKLN